jgi:hypothetical protein
MLSRLRPGGGETIMLETLQQIWALARQRKKIFLIPLVAVLVVVGGLLVVAQGSVVAPFIYALF